MAMRDVLRAGLPARRRWRGRERVRSGALRRLASDRRSALVPASCLCARAARAIKIVGNKKARSRMNRLRACSLPHVGMRADREGSVIGFARCTAKQNLPVHLKRSRVDRAANAKTLRRKACYRCQGKPVRTHSRPGPRPGLEPEQAQRARFAPNRIPPVPPVAGAMCARAGWPSYPWACSDTAAAPTGRRAIAAHADRSHRSHSAR